MEYAAMRRVRASCAPASIRRPKQWTRLLADILPRPILVFRSLLPGKVPLLRPLTPAGMTATKRTGEHDEAKLVAACPRQTLEGR